MKYFFLGIYRLVLGILTFVTFPIWIIMLIGGWEMGEFMDKLWGVQ